MSSRKRLAQRHDATAARSDSKDDSLSEFATRLAKEADSKLLPPGPRSVVSATKLEKMSDRKLVRLWKDLSQQYEFELNAPIVAARDWLETRTLEFRKQALKTALANIAHETKRRDLAPHNGTSPAGERTIPAKKASGDVAKRRAIVRNNAGLTALRVCKLLDGHGVPLSLRTDESLTWTGAYKKSAYRRRIDTLFSKDRRTDNG